LEVFRSPKFQDVSLNQWLALTPPELVKEHLDVSDKVIKSLRKEKWPIVKNWYNM
jgi:oxalate decarboxylase